jgi:hypothetical protein
MTSAPPKLPEDINWELYRFYNTDLAHMDQEQIIAHYNKFGKFEKRRDAHELPEDFVVEEYRDMNNDLDFLSDEELKKHYTLSGAHENRAYRISDTPSRRIFTKKVGDVKVPGVTYINR